MANCKSCNNCANRMHYGMFGMEPCYGWECTEDEADAISTAEHCDEWCAEEEDEEEDCAPSATGGDYGPGNPWDAPGMSVSDFISGTIY